MSVRRKAAGTVHGQFTSLTTVRETTLSEEVCESVVLNQAGVGYLATKSSSQTKSVRVLGVCHSPTAMGVEFSDASALQTADGPAHSLQRVVFHSPHFHAALFMQLSLKTTQLSNASSQRQFSAAEISVYMLDACCGSRIRSTRTGTLSRKVLTA